MNEASRASQLVTFARLKVLWVGVQKISSVERVSASSDRSVFSREFRLKM